MNDKPPRLVTYTIAGAYSGYSEHSIRYAVRTGKLKKYVVGPRANRVDLNEVDEVFTQRPRLPASMRKQF